MFHMNEYWYKIRRKTDLCFLKRHMKFGKFSQSGFIKCKMDDTFKVSEIFWESCQVRIFSSIFSTYISRTWWRLIWKINLIILWSYIIKNVQVKHGQCDSIIFHKTFSFESSKQLSDFCLANSRIPYFWQVLESIHKCIIELLVLKCLFVGSLIKNKEGVGLFSVSQKEGLSIFYDNQVLLRLMSQCGPPSCTLQNRSYSPLHFGQEENIPEHSIERRAYWFVVKIARVLLIPTGRVGIVSWTLL